MICIADDCEEKAKKTYCQEHLFSFLPKQCKAPGCSETPLALQLKNMRFSKNFCEKHRYQLEVACISCTKIYTMSSKKFKEAGLCRSCISIKSSPLRIAAMKENGSYDRWRASCESKESRVLGYQNMVKNGNVKNLISASNKPDVILAKQKSRIDSGSFDKFMSASRETLRERWKNPEEASKMLKNLTSYHKSFIYSNACEIHPEEIRQVFRASAYSCWGCTKTSILDSVPTSILNIHTDQIWIPTLRESLNTSKGQIAMEQYLVDQNISWFTYIKFYSNNDQIVPLVAGKTGSKLVNIAGTDIRFRYDGVNPGRTFLRESKLVWHTDKVLIIPTENEIDAFKLEIDLAQKLDLFYS